MQQETLGRLALTWLRSVFVGRDGPDRQLAGCWVVAG
jgi:hypothetical protein